MDRRRRSLRATARRSTAAAEGAVEGDSRPLPPHHPCAPRREQVRIAAAFAHFRLLGEAEHAAVPDEILLDPAIAQPAPLGVAGEHAIGEASVDDLGYRGGLARFRSEEHTSELQSLMRHTYAVFCVKK